MKLLIGMHLINFALMDIISEMDGWNPLLLLDCLFPLGIDTCWE